MHARRHLFRFHALQPNFQAQGNAVTALLRTGFGSSKCCSCMFESFRRSLWDFICWDDIFNTKVTSETALRNHLATFGRMNPFRFCVLSGAAIFGPAFRGQTKTRIKHIPGARNSGRAWGCSYFRARFGRRISDHVLRVKSNVVDNAF